MHKIFDAHCHSSPTTRETKYKIDNQEYVLAKQNISINPDIVPELICSADNLHFVHFDEAEKNKVSLRCAGCGKNLQTNVKDPFLKPNITLIEHLPQGCNVFIMPALTNSSVNYSIEYLLEKYPHKVAGIKLYSGKTNTLLNEIKSFDYNLPLLIHTGTFPNQDPKNMIKFLQKYDGPICLAHFARFEPSAMKLAKELDNIYVDTCPAKYMHKRYIEQKFSGAKGFFDEKGLKKAEDLYLKLIDLVGIDKVLWGSDFPICNTAEELEVVHNLDISKRDKKKILWQNAQEFMEK
ncbi:MAG: amidohydrolase family protein [Clostridia bacterium]